jgi:hypothetical protein
LPVLIYFILVFIKEGKVRESESEGWLFIGILGGMKILNSFISSHSIYE